MGRGAAAHREEPPGRRGRDLLRIAGEREREEEGEPSSTGDPFPSSPPERKGSAGSSSGLRFCEEFVRFIGFVVDRVHCVIMRLNKTEVNLRRLLAAAPHQQNQAKLIHYVTTLREQLEQLGAERTPEGISSVSKAKLNEYSEKIEALAAKLSTPSPEPVKVVDETKDEESPSKSEQDGNYVNAPRGLRRRTVAHVEIEDSIQESKERDSATPIKLDAAAQIHIEKHRKLQEDLTDEMVVLAQQLKESSLLMNQSLQNTEKILDSTERAVEHSLASTGRANVRAMEVYSESSKTTCFTWLVIFVMTCIFIMVVLLIRVT